MNGLLVGGVIGEGLKSFVNSYNATQDRQRQQAESDETRALRRRQMAGADYDAGRQWDDEAGTYKAADGAGEINPREQKALSRLIEMQKAAGENWYRKEYDGPRNAMKALSGKLYGAGGDQQPTGGMIQPTPSVGQTGSGLVKQPGLISAPQAPARPKAAIKPQMAAPVAQAPAEPMDEYEKMARQVEAAPIPGYNPKDYSDGFEPKFVRDEKIKRAQRAQEIRLKGKEKGVGQATDGQANAAGFASRVEEANGIFDELEGGGFDRADARYDFQEDVASIPVVGKYTRGAQDPRLIRQAQAERNFINALLRRESGANIAPSEFSSAELQYFPRTGDTPEVKAQKKQNRLTALAGLRAGAGDRAMDRIGKERAALGQAPQVAPTQKPQGAKPAPGSLITHRNGKVFRLAPDGDTLIEVK